MSGGFQNSLPPSESQAKEQMEKLFEQFKKGMLYSCQAFLNQTTKHWYKEFHRGSINYERGTIPPE